MKMEEITPENLKDLDINSIALNKDKLGSLTFDVCLPFMEKLHDFFVELGELGYKERLSEVEVKRIDDLRLQFIEYLKRLVAFDPGSDPNSNKSTHDDFESEIKLFYENVIKEMREGLVYLRQETDLKSKNKQELNKQKKATLQAESEYKKLAKKLEDALKKISDQHKELEDKRSKLESEHGEIATAQLAQYFEGQSDKHVLEANKWLKWRRGFLISLFVIVIVGMSGYLVTFFLVRLNWIGFELTDLFSVQYVIAKIVLISVIWYGLIFCSRNYNIHSNLVAINSHRRNVAQTLEDFLAAPTDPQSRPQMVKEGTEAMFKHFPTGYLSKRSGDSSENVIEIVSNVLKSNKDLN